MVVHKVVKGKYIQQDLGDILAHRQRFRLLRSPPGTGKTSYMAKEFKRIIEDHPDYVCVAISPRCSVTQQHFKSFKKLGFIHYSQHKDDLALANRIIITLDSLAKIDKDIDVIYIDEVESLLEHVFADTIKHRNQVWQKLLYVCSHAKLVIATDADFGDLSISFFKTVLGALRDNNILLPKEVQQSTLFLDNIQPTESLNVHLSTNRKQWYQQLERILACDSSKVFIGCDSRKAACNIRQQIKAWLKCQASPSFTSDQILLYTSHDGDKQDLIDVNLTWANAKIVICSPTVVYGIDYDNKTAPFTAVMGFYTQQGQTLGADKIRQQLRRARTIIRSPDQPWHVYIYIFSPPVKHDYLRPLFPTSTIAIREQLQDLCSSFRTEISHHIPVIIDGMGSAQIVSDPLTNLYIEFIRKRNLSKFKLCSVLRKLLLHENHNVNVVQAPDPNSKVEINAIWTTEAYLNELYLDEKRQFQDAFDFASVLKCQQDLKIGLPQFDDKSVRGAVVTLQDTLAITRIDDQIIQHLKNSPVLMQFLRDPQYKTCFYRFRSLCTQRVQRFCEETECFGVHVNQSDIALLEVLHEVEKNVLQMTRFECLFLTDNEIRALCSQMVVISSNLLNLVRTISVEKVPSSISTELFSKEDSDLSKYSVYKWVCRVYGYFCSSRCDGKKSQIITGQKIKVFPLQKNQKAMPVTENTKKCPCCNEIKDKSEFKKNGRCPSCNSSIRVYKISQNKFRSVIQLIQLVFFHDRSKFSVALHKSLRVDEPIIVAFRNYPADETINRLFTTASCKTLGDILTLCSTEHAHIFRAMLTETKHDETKLMKQNSLVMEDVITNFDLPVLSVQGSEL